MKPLTIDELKALQVGDWVWIKFEINNPIDRRYAKQERYFQIIEPKNDTTIQFNNYAPMEYADYGTKWLAYKNKEMAEAKGEIVETGKYFIEPERLPNRPLRYLICDYSVSKGVRDMCDTLEEAERRLAELKGE